MVIPPVRRPISAWWGLWNKSVVWQTDNGFLTGLPTMADTPLTSYNPAPYDDEISISELLLKLWAKRGLVVMLPLVLAGLTLVGLLMGKTNHQNTVSFYIELNGISLTSVPKSTDSDSDRDSDRDSNRDSDSEVTTRYPNGTRFSPQDLSNPSVISLLAAETGLETKDLAEHINIEFGTPVSNGVLLEYKAALAANSKASMQDLAALNARYEAKLAAASKRGLKITVNYVELGISQSEGSGIAELLPRLWNRVYTEQFATRLPAEISTLRWTENRFDLTSAIGLQEADVQLANLAQGAELIAKDDRFKGIRGGQGTLAGDLAGYIEDYRSIFFDPLFLAAFRKNDTLTRVYTQDLKFEMAELEQEIAEVNQRLTDIRQFQGGERAAAGASTAREATQLDGSALSTVVNLAEQAALSSYLQESLDLRYELTKKLGVLNTRLARINPDAGESATVGDDFVTLAIERYDTITQSYEDILTKAQAIADANSPTFYSVITQSNTEGSLIAKRDLLFIVLALALGGMLAIIASLVWPQRQA